MAVGSMTLVQIGLALSVPLFGEIGPPGPRSGSGWRGPP